MPRRVRMRNPVPKLDPVYIRFLLFVASQHAVTVGQLARFFGVYRTDMERFIREFEAERLIESKQFLTGDDTRIWLRSKGCALVGRKYKSAPENPQMLAHWGAITDARLWMEENYKVIGWYSEGDLRRLFPPGPSRTNMPDALAKVTVLNQETGIQEEEYIAIEAELSKKSPSKLHRKMWAYEKYYEHFAKIIYFATPEICAHFSRHDIDVPHPKMSIVEIPSVCRQINNPKWAIETDPCPLAPVGEKRIALYRSLTKSRLVLLKLFADQQVVWMDQIGEFFKIKEDNELVESLILEFVRKGLLQRAQPFPDQPILAWLTRLGVGALQRECDQSQKSQEGLYYYPPSIGGLKLKRLINMIRLEVEAVGGAWVSARQLREIFKSKGFKLKGALPGGSFELDSRRHFVDVFVSPVHPRTLRKRFDRRLSIPHKDGNSDSERIVWYYNNRSRSSLAKFHKEIWPWLVQKYGEEAKLKLQLRPLPDYEPKQSLVPSDTRTSRKRASCVSMWSREIHSPVTEFFSVPVECVPLEAIEIVAKAASTQHRPRVLEAWQRCCPLGKLYLLETDVGMFRVSGFRGWHADESINDDWFVKVELETALSAMSLKGRRSFRELLIGAVGPASSQVREPEEFIVDSVLWAELEPLIPSIQHRLNSTQDVILDRAILSGLIWRLRNESRWRNIPAKLGFGSTSAIDKRLREWEELGVWEDIQRILQARLPDGEFLNWPRLARIKDRSLPLLKPHQLALLAELRQHPDREYTIKSYGTTYERSEQSAAADLRDLAELNLLVGTRCKRVYSFRAAPDLTPRLERLLSTH
jgi:transposase